MPLSFFEKRAIQRAIVEQNKILSGSPSFTVKRQAQKVKVEAMTKLGMVVKQQSNTEVTEIATVDVKIEDKTINDDRTINIFKKEYQGSIAVSFNEFRDWVRWAVSETNSIPVMASGKFSEKNLSAAAKRRQEDSFRRTQLKKLGFSLGSFASDTPPDQKIKRVFDKAFIEQNLGTDQTNIDNSISDIQAGLNRTTTGHFYDFDPNRKLAQRKRENTQAIALIRQIEAGDVDGAQLTDEQKATLAKYSGLGGALVGIDGQKGSAYEYYTPKPIAQGVWGLAEELGFTGGKVLDPSAGVGIFSATAPESAVVDAVELDETSGLVNKLVNGGVGSNVTIAPFEQVAASTPDEEYDAVITNVPFGTNAARGNNKMHDKRYQKESLQSYFILRSLEKLKPGGLAVFIVPPSVVTGLGIKETSLRVRASFAAEFLGAYRLPNTVFGTAQADTITDVIAFRKYSREVAEKIAELKEQSPDTLIAAKVQWPEFTEGQYFKGEGRRFVLGEFIPKIEGDKFSRDQIVSNASIGEIGKMLRKFPGSRIDWALLDATETEAILYKEGDTVTQAGQTLQWTDNHWVALKHTNDNSAILESLAALTSPYAAFQAKATFDTAVKARDYWVTAGLSLDIPSWLRDALYQVEKRPSNDRQKFWNAGVIGLSCAQVLEERLSEETGVNYLEDYPELSEAMQRVASTAKASASKVGGDIKQGLLKIGHHYTAKAGVSALWRGDVLQSVAAAVTTHDASFEGLLYKNKSPWANIEEAKAIYGDSFDPMTDSVWCISSDGQKIIRADDYYVGNYAAFIKKVDADIAAATDRAVIAKLLRQKLDAEKYLDKIDVKSLSFNLFSPHVTHEEKAEFLRKFGYPAAAVIYDEKTGDKRVDIDIKITKNSTGRDKLANRVGDYLKNGTISLGGADTGMSTVKALAELRRMVNTANEQFNGWVAANPQIMNRLEGKANDPALLAFRLADDESPMQIPGMNPGLTLHGYQNSWVRKMGRDFSDINGFDVGLGKTFSALAAVQYIQAIGVKNKTIFAMPNSVLSKWRKEAIKAYATIDDCLFVGLRANKKGKLVVNASFIDADLSLIMENRHSKIFVTFETFERIKIRDATIDRYEAYLGSIDSNYETSLNVKDREEADSKKAGIRAVLSGKTGAAPFLEDLGIDSVVIDEAHGFKSSAQIFNTKSAKFLSLPKIAQRGIDAQCKAWFIRGMSPRTDGVSLLTATPITNSPLEIYSMLSLAKGHDKVNAMMLGIRGADEFMAMMTDIENQDDVTIDGIERTTNVFVGLNNVGVLRRAIGQSSTIKSAADVGAQVDLPDGEDHPATVDLSDDTVDRLMLYKDAFRWAIDDLSGKKDNRGSRAAYDSVADYFGETQALIAHPFNLINKMTLLIADPELDRRATFFTIAPGNTDKAIAVIEDFNKRKFKEKRERAAPFTDADAVISKKMVTDDETGDKYEELTIEVRADLQPDGKTIVIDTMDSQTQLRWDEMAEKAGLDLDVTIPPKLAALLENVQYEQANPRGIDQEGNHSPIVKQIIFCDILALHSKIRRLLSKKAGIPVSKIAIITGKTNNTPDEIMAVQDGFNAHGEDNQYQNIIANEKAEVGIDLQQGTQAIHHLTIGWTPDSKIQRDGRGKRQGNKTAKVNIYTYDADGTFDVAKRDMVNKKGDWIGEVMAVDGDNKVSISGGLSKEQLEELINVTGDSAAMSRIQESVAAKEAEARATTNIAKQKVNIDTIQKQRKFIDDNDPVTDFIIPKIASLYTIKNQILMIQSRIDNPKATATAAFKNQAVLGELQAKERGISEQISGSVTIKALSGYGTSRQETVITAEQAIDRYKSDYAKNNRYTAEGFAEKLGQTYQYLIEVTDGSPMHTEWAAELAMAQSMIDTALSNFTQQSKQPGGLPAEVGKAFAEGRGVEHNGELITVGSFLRIDPYLAIITERHGLVAINGAEPRQLSIPNTLESIILPGSSDYESCLIEAAKLEDASGLNTYSEIAPEVTQYRTTARVKEYSADKYQLPQPYFPIAIAKEQIQGNALLQAIFDDQAKIVLSLRTEYSTDYFTVTYEQEVDASQGGVTLASALAAYARANNKTIAWDLHIGGEHTFNYAIKKELEATFEVEDEDELKALLADKTTIEELGQTFVDFVKSKIGFIDFTGATVDDVVLLMPFDIYYPYNKAKSDVVRKAEMASNATVQPALPAVATEEEVDQLFGKSSGDPDETVAITGDTKAYYLKIKAIAGQYGGGKYKWDGRNSAWNVRRITWDKLIESYPSAADNLKIIPATIARL
ncbi:MAG: hypothetical protein M0Q44_01585 [Methylobacter sp.]|jgi:hypothetical protein|nr:hypothetical protein [Methylobacter sp.]